MANLRDWQIDAFEELKDKKYRIINAMTGSGKSYLMNHLAINDWVGKGIKTIIAIPQEIVAASFIGEDISHEFEYGEYWTSELITNTFVEKDKRKCLMEFIANGTGLCLVSHKTFLKTYKQHQKEFNDTKLNLFIDEAHHIADSKVYSNKLGKAISTIIENKKTSITLSTATFFRGDKLEIISKEKMKSFSTFFLDVSSYMKSMKYLKGFNIIIDTYDITNPFKWLQNNREEVIDKSIIYLPYATSFEFETIGSKKQWIDGIIKSINPNNKEVKNDSGVMNVDGTKVLDLVDDSNKTRKKTKEYLIKNQKNASAIDIILALGMMKEGANFVPAKKAFIFGTRNSLNELVQILGRILRDAPGKNLSEMTILVPKTIYTEQKKAFENNGRSLIKATIASMVINDTLTANTEHNEKKRSSHLTTKNERNCHPWTLLSGNDRVKLLEECIEESISRGDIHEDEVRQLIYQVVLESELVKKSDINTVVEKIYKMNMKQLLKDEKAFPHDYHTVNPFNWILDKRIITASTLNEARQLLGVKSKIAWGALKEKVQDLGILSQKEYFENYDLIEGAPMHPDRTYCNFWKGWLNFFGLESVEWLRYEELSRIVKQYKFQSPSAYKSKYKEIKGAPSNPNTFYKEEWISWSDFLGDRSNWIQFDDLKALVLELGISSSDQYRSMYKNIECAPRNPDVIYKDLWKGWPSFFGRTRKVTLSFEELKSVVQGAGIKSSNDYKAKYKEISGAPSNPPQKYKDEWVSWIDFLQTA